MEITEITRLKQLTKMHFMSINSISKLFPKCLLSSFSEIII